MSSSKLAEANKQIAEGEKFLKTSLFKWRSDYDSAAPCFRKAAIAYKNAEKFEKAAELFTKQAECHYKDGSRFHAAKAYEEAGLMFMKMGKLDQFSSNFDHASNLYLEDGTPDTAAMCLVRAGKNLEEKEPSWALQMFNKAADIYSTDESEGRLREAVNIVGRISRLLTKMGKFNEALQSIDREISLYGRCSGDHGASSRLHCCKVLICCSMGDFVRAEGCLDEAECNAEDHGVLSELLDAVRNSDEEKLNATKRLPLFKYMDVVYARLARDLYISRGGGDNPNLEDGDEDLS